MTNEAQYDLVLHPKTFRSGDYVMKRLNLNKRTLYAATLLSLTLTGFTAPRVDVDLDRSASLALADTGWGSGEFSLRDKSGEMRGTLFDQSGAAAWKLEAKISVSALLPKTTGAFKGELVGKNGKSIEFSGRFTAAPGGYGVIEAVDASGKDLFDGIVKLSNMSAGRKVFGVFKLKWRR
jgi:hypothetical protein